jgi:hypothetical protein
VKASFEEDYCLSFFLDPEFVLIPQNFDNKSDCGYDIALIGISSDNLEKINLFIDKVKDNEKLKDNPVYFEDTDQDIFIKESKALKLGVCGYPAEMKSDGFT